MIAVLDIIVLKYILFIHIVNSNTGALEVIIIHKEDRTTFSSEYMMKVYEFILEPFIPLLYHIQAEYKENANSFYKIVYIARNYIKKTNDFISAILSLKIPMPKYERYHSKLDSCGKAKRKSINPIGQTLRLSTKKRGPALLEL